MRRLIPLLTVLVLVAGACGGADSPDAATGTTTEPTSIFGTMTTMPTTTAALSSTTMSTTARHPTTTLPSATGGLDEAFLAEQIGTLQMSEGKGAALAVVIDANGDVVYAARGTDDEGNPPTPNDGFRVGSITKLFTALRVLQLVDAGEVNIDASVDQYVTRIDVPDGVRVRDLLQHTSGIFDFGDAWLSRMSPEDFLERVWSPEAIFELIDDEPPLFAPGAEYAYSNTNYLILGILIEEVTGSSFASEIRSRIIEPLGLESTYLAGFEDGPAPFDAYYSTGELRASVLPVDFDYTPLATWEWAVGAMVSTAPDLHTLLSALFDGRMVSAASLAVMTGTDEHGPSVFLAPAHEGPYWHTGSVIGYLTFVTHAPGTGTTAFLGVTNDRPYRGRNVVAERINEELRSHSMP